jgi:hypothetical protein
MRKRWRFEGAALVLATAIALMAGGTARAGLLQITFHETGFTDVTITDRIGGVGDPNDLNGNANQILALIPASFTDYSGSVIVSSNNTGNGALGTLNLNPNVAEAVSGANPLTLTATQTGFLLPGGSGSTVKFTSTLAVSGITSGTVGLIGSIDSTSTPAQSLSAPATNIQTLTYVRGATYSLTAQSTIALTGTADTTNYSATVSAVAVIPEPASLTLLATGALGLLGYAWRRRKATA